MRKLISARLAATVLLCALGLLTLFHILVLLRIVPADIVWGGRLDASSPAPTALETVALVVTVLFALVIAARAGYLGILPPASPVRTATWVVFGYFVLNIVGNLASDSSIERWVFLPFTAVLAVLTWRVAIE